MQIQEITLLTSNEYKALRPLIPVIKQSWWLKDYSKHECPYIVSFLDADIFDWAMPQGERFVRPALRITDAQVKPGDKMTIFAYQWTVLQTEKNVTLVLCDDVVTARIYDKASRSYESSDIKKWLEGWLAKRQKTADEKKYARYKCMNRIGLQYLCSDFLRYWLTPMALLLPIAIVFFCYSQGLPSFEGTPAWMLNTLQMVCMVMYGVILLTSLLTTLFVVLSPHQDTGFRHILNTIWLIAILVLYWNPVTPHDFTTLISVAALAAINHRYLQKIKYHS